MNAEQVPPRHDFAQDVRVALPFLANHEESGLRARLIEHVENGTRVPWMRAVIERQGDPTGAFGTVPKHTSEHLERGPEHAQGDQPRIGQKSRPDTQRGTGEPSKRPRGQRQRHGRAEDEEGTPGGHAGSIPC